MSSDRETTRIVRSWLEEGVIVLPDRVLDHVLDRLPATPQRRHWWQAWRNPLVSNTTKFVLGGAAVLVLAAVGIGIYFGQSGGGPGVPGPTPSSTPSGTPTASPPADSQPPSPAASVPPAGDLVPGTYVISSDPFSAQSPLVVVRVPAGYEAIGNNVRPYAVVKSGDEPAAFSGLGIWEVDAVYEDPCRWSATDVDSQSLGPRVDDFVAALLAQPGRTFWVPGTNPPVDAANHLDGPADTRIADVNVDGYAGKRVVLGVPPDIAFDGTFTDCDEEEYRSWPGRFHQAPSQFDDVRVLDVDGTRLIIATTYFPTTSEQDQAELDAMFQSIDIQLP